MNRTNPSYDSLLSSHIKRILEVLKQPSIFCDLPNIRRCAELYVKYLREAGFQKTSLVETGRSPIVQAEYYCGAPKTVLIYSYFDMLPQENETHEFKAEITNISPFGRCLIGRGIASKGAGVAFINAVEGFLNAQGRLPVNVKFLAEGEEMYGSDHIPWFINHHGQWLHDIDAVYVPSMSQGLDGRPISISLGGKGFIGFELTCSGANWGRGPKGRDAHSSTKSIVDSPMWRLVKAINTLVSDDDERILIDGFFENVRSPTAKEKELALELYNSLNEEILKKRLDVDTFLHDSKGIDVLMHYLFDPTLNMEGIPLTSVDPVGVVSHKATAKLQSRIVPDQTVSEIIEKIRSHLRRCGYGDIEIRTLYGFGPARTSLDAPIIQAVLRLYGDAGLEPPAVYPSSPASSPVNALNNTLGIPCASGGLGHVGREQEMEYLVLDDCGRIAGLAQIEKSFIDVLHNYFEHSIGDQRNTLR
jgi:acetylornithine deacetylase/succinyl-diaminopimelate desuccinylase-like protein